MTKIPKNLLHRAAGQAATIMAIAVRDSPAIPATGSGHRTVVSPSTSLHSKPDSAGAFPGGIPAVAFDFYPLSKFFRAALPACRIGIQSRLRP